MTLTIAIPEEKLTQVIKDCEKWLVKKRASKHMIQSIAGRLIYIAYPIPPARKFTARILGSLRAMEDNAWITLSEGFKADLRWFVKYTKVSNGIFLFSPQRPTVEVECDSSLLGGGGYFYPFCYSWTFTSNHNTTFPKIHHLEAVNILVAYQKLGTIRKFQPAKVVIYTDNMASSCVLSSGKTKDETFAACSR